MPQSTSRFQSGPVLEKDMVVAHAGKNLKNGKLEFDLSVKSLDVMVSNFEEQGRQVPIFLGGEHFENRDGRPADGWVVSLRRDGDDLIASVKLHGMAAVAVNEDLMRGISIGTVLGKDVHGEPLGDVLDHLLITNQPFFGDLNIAASDKQAEGRVSYFTACTHEGAEMAKTKRALAEHPEDEKDEAKKLEGHPQEEDELDEHPDDEKEELDEHPDDDDDDEFPEEEFTVASFKKLRKLVKRFQRLQRSLEGENETLKVQLKARRGLASKDKEELAVRLERLETERTAQSVRELVREGLDKLTLKGSWVKGFKGEDADGGLGTLEWLKTSRFADSMNPLDIDSAVRTLKYQVIKGTPIARMDQHYQAGQTPGSTALSSDEQQVLRTQGIDEEQFKALNRKDGGKAYRALVKRRADKE